MSGKTHGLSNVVYYNGAVCVAVVHGCQGLVAFLSGGIPYFKLDGCGVIEGNGLGEKGGTDSRFTVIVKLVLDKAEY